MFQKQVFLKISHNLAKQNIIYRFTVQKHLPGGRNFFNFLRAGTARSALLRNEILYSLLKTPKTYTLQGVGEGGCIVLNALNLEKRGVTIHSCAFSMDFPALFWLYRTRAFIFQNKPWEVCHKKGVFKNFPKFTGKHLCRNLF